MVQFGWGSRQRRIQAAETDRTSAVAEAIAQDKELAKILLHAAGVPDIWHESAWEEEATIARLPDVNLLITLGGDGTLLRAARILNHREIPILGLSYGHLGFLTAASPEERDILQVVSDALSGELHVSRRATIAADIVSVREDGTKDVVRTFALNDMALTRGPLSDMVKVAGVEHVGLQRVGHDGAQLAVISWEQVPRHGKIRVVLPVIIDEEG